MEFFKDFSQSVDLLLSKNKDNYDLLQYSGTVSVRKNPSILEINHPQDIFLLKNDHILIAETKIVREIANKLFVRSFGLSEEIGEIIKILPSLDEEKLAIIYNLKNKINYVIYDLIKGELIFNDSIEGSFIDILAKTKDFIFVVSKFNQDSTNEHYIYQTDLISYKTELIGMNDVIGNQYVLVDDDTLFYNYGDSISKLELNTRVRKRNLFTGRRSVNYLKISKDKILIVYDRGSFALYDKSFKLLNSRNSDFGESLIDIHFDFNTNKLWLLLDFVYKFNKKILRVYDLDDGFKLVNNLTVSNEMTKLKVGQNEKYLGLTSSELLFFDNNKQIAEFTITREFNIAEVGLYYSKVILKDETLAYTFDFAELWGSNEPTIKIDRTFRNMSILYGKNQLLHIAEIVKNSKNIIQLVQQLYKTIVSSNIKTEFIPVPQLNGDIELYKDSKLTSKLIGHKAEIKSFDSFDKLLISADVSGDIKFWNMENLSPFGTEPILNLYFYNREWVIWIDRDHYLYSKGAGNLYGFNIETFSGKNKFFTFSQLSSNYNRDESQRKIKKLLSEFIYREPTKT